MEPIAEKKKAIFESTLELIREHGFHGTPMSLVAKRAGVAAGTIYHYFESKERLICELFDYARKQVIAVVQKEDCATIPFKECFFNMWFGLYTFYQQNPNVFKFFEQFTNSPYNTDKAGMMQDEFHRLLFAFFERGILFAEHITDVFYVFSAGEDVVPAGKAHLLVSLVHIIGGLMIAFGFLTRLALLCQFPIIIGMLLIVSPQRGANIDSAEIVLSVIAVGLLLFFMIVGPGRYSVDNKILRQKQTTSEG